MWGWVEMKYADGLTLVLDSREWGSGYTRKESRGISLSDLSEADRKKIDAMPDPEPLRGFAEAVKTRKQAGGHPEAAHRCQGAPARQSAGPSMEMRFSPVFGNR